MQSARAEQGMVRSAKKIDGAGGWGGARAVRQLRGGTTTGKELLRLQTQQRNFELSIYLIIIINYNDHVELFLLGAGRALPGSSLHALLVVQRLSTPH